MDPALAPFYDRLKDLYTEESFEAKARELDEAFGGLLDPEAVGLLLLDEHGRNAGAVVTLAECRGRPEATVLVTVDRVLPAREFAREGGTGRVVNVEVTDATGGARLTLWDRDAEKAEDGTLAPGARVKVVNARVKDSRFGLELHVTPWTVLEVEGALDPARRKLLTDTLPDAAPAGVAAPADAAVAAAEPAALPEGVVLPPASERPATRQAAILARADPEPLGSARAGDTLHLVRATVRGVQPTRPFRRRDGTTGFVANVEVEDASGRASVTLWDEAVRAVQKCPPGTEVELTDLVAKEHQGRLELHSTRATRVSPAGVADAR